MNNLETMQFLGRCLTPGREDLDILLAEQISSDVLDWKRLMLIASGHFLTPSLYLALQRRDLLDIVPVEIKGFLQANDLLNRERNAILFEQLITVTRQLNTIDIQPLLLKGANCLLPDQYPESEGRVMGDLDLLVPKHRIEDSIQSLAKLGYNFPPKTARILYAGCHHLPPLSHSEHPVLLEIHRDVYPRHVKPIFSTADMWESARKVEFSGTHALVPDNSLRILHNVVHARLHHRHHRNFVLDMRQLNEWVQLCGFYVAEIDMQSMWERFNLHDEAAALESYLLAARRFFDQPLPQGIYPSQKAISFERVMCIALKVPILWTVLNTDRYLFYPKRLLSPSWYRRKFKGLRAALAWKDL